MSSADENGMGDHAENQGFFGSNLLIEEQPLQVLRSLAVAIGLVEAIVTQQVYWLFKNPANGRMLKDGRRWLYNSAREWQEQYLPFMSEDQIQRTFKRLEQYRILESCQPEGGISRRKYYRFNDGMLHLLKQGKLQIPHSTQLRNGSATARFPNIRDDSQKEQRQSKESPLQGVCSFLPSKEELLMKKRRPKNAPTEQEFLAFLDGEDFMQIPNRYPDVWEQLVRDRFHVWRVIGKRGRWVPIRDWKAFVRGLETKMQEACGQ